MKSTHCTLIGVLLLAACGSHLEMEHPLVGAFTLHGRNAEVVVDPEATLLPPPPFSTEDIFPCFECHDPDFLEIDPTRRELGEPHDIPTFTDFNHAGDRIWCLDCHDAEDRDRLHLSDGRLLEFDQAPQLCGQCHGVQYRDWQAGAHGKRIGNWDGPKQYFPCTRCHSPHNPLFGSLEPMPPPRPPGTAR